MLKLVSAGEKGTASTHIHSVNEDYSNEMDSIPKISRNIIKQNSIHSALFVIHTHGAVTCLKRASGCVCVCVYLESSSSRIPF